MKIKLIFLCVGLLIIANGCMMSYRNHVNITGTINDQYYTSPTKVFSCKRPYLVTPGYRIEDHISKDKKAGDVLFQDDFGKWINIIYLPKILPVFEEKKVLKRFITRKNIKVLHKENMRIKNTNIIYCIVREPKASNMISAEKGRFDLIEGIFVFSRKNHVYILSIQDTSFIFGKKTTPEELVKILKNELMNFYNDMKFKK
jgi:hypothetical protein